MAYKPEWDAKAELIIAFTQYPQTRQGFEEYLDERAEIYDEIRFYRENGSWRDTDIDPDVRDEVLEGVFNQQSNNCYYNVQTALTPDVTYVEGYALSGKGVPAPHSWLEAEGSVVEITPPLSEVEKVDYWGVAVNNVTVVEAMTAREQADPIVEYILEQGYGYDDIRVDADLTSA